LSKVQINDVLEKWDGIFAINKYRIFFKFDHPIYENDTSPFGKGGSRGIFQVDSLWDDENHQKLSILDCSMKFKNDTFFRGHCLSSNKGREELKYLFLKYQNRNSASGQDIPNLPLASVMILCYPNDHDRDRRIGISFFSSIIASFSA
jgi:hypothetical protein